MSNEMTLEEKKAKATELTDQLHGLGLPVIVLVDLGATTCLTVKGTGDQVANLVAETLISNPELKPLFSLGLLKAKMHVEETNG